MGQQHAKKQRETYNDCDSLSFWPTNHGKWFWCSSIAIGSHRLLPAQNRLEVPCTLLSPYLRSHAQNPSLSK